MRSGTAGGGNGNHPVDSPRRDVIATRRTCCATGMPLTPQNVFWRVQPAREEAGLTWVGFHMFRRTPASSVLFAPGRNARQAQPWLGHRSPALTLSTYVHLLDNDLAEPFDLSEPFSPDQPTRTAMARANVSRPSIVDS
jgi:integrase